MDFGLSRRLERCTTKTRTSSTILNETDVILAGDSHPGTTGCVSSPNSTNIAEMNFSSNSGLKNQDNISKHTNTTINNSMDQSRGNISRHDEVVDQKIKVYEAYLSQLKSIDLKKYSFPNENKPKTDYTYANTSSYISNSRNDDCPMPNLCRRSRISPPSNRLINFPFSSRTPPTTNTLQNSHHEAARDYMSEKSDQRLSFFAQIRQYIFSNKTTIEKKTIIKTSSSESSSVYSQETGNFKQSGKVYSTSTSQPKLNIGPFLNEDENTQSQRNSQPTFAQNYQAVNNKRKFSCFGLLSWVLFFLIFSPFVLFALQRINKHQEFSMDEAMLKDFQFFLRNDLQESMTKYSSYLLKESEKTFDQSAKLAKQKLDLSLMYAKSALDQNYKVSKKFIGKFTEDCWEVYFPQMAHMSSWLYQVILENTKNLYEFLKQLATTTTANIVNTVEYKLPTFRSEMTESDSEKKEIIKDYVLLKEKIFSEAMEIVKNSLQKSDVESMRKELDLKFNYTLSLMANKLIDQSMQIEISKANHEKELKQMKDVLNELENRYTYSMEQLQEKLTAQTNKLEEQNQQLNRQQQHKASDIIKNNPELQEELKSYIQSSHEQISFEKIEEYVNKTFYLYNADKTGMTDFASEAVGGSILFTRCTEVYTENSRWFTVFDVPISRLTVSPRVVIQGTVQPGNCWGFKGDKGDLFIKLAAKITPTSFSIEHIPKELSLTGKIDSAPQNFTVYGYESVELIADKNRFILGNFRYDNTSKQTLQFFETQYTYLDTPIRVIELKIESNAGNKDYTCLYKFRVHGKLFESIQNQKQLANELESKPESEEKYSEVTTDN